jgi:hypothetical protein
VFAALAALAALAAMLQLCSAAKLQQCGRIWLVHAVGGAALLQHCGDLGRFECGVPHSCNIAAGSGLFMRLGVPHSCNIAAGSGLFMGLGVPHCCNIAAVVVVAVAAGGVRGW